MKNNWPSKKSLFLFQLFLSGIALGIFSWNLVTALKPILVEHFRVALYPWTYIFFHPYESNLFNYLFLCGVLWIFGLVFYFFIKKNIARILENSVYKYRSLHFVVLPVVSVLLLACTYFSPLKFRLMLSLAVFLIPLYLFQDHVSRIRRWRRLAIGILLFLVSLEPMLLVKGPAYVINEYEDIFSQTYVGEQYVNNRVFLQELQDLSLEDLFQSFVTLYNRREGKDRLRLPSLTAIFQHFENRNIHSAQFFMALDDTAADEEDDPPPAELKSVDLERIKKFYFINRLEYIHQNMSRGQFNHIGHILNPINEYQLGKPVGSIYLQYGVGNTFLMKWVMEWFGGPSIHSYYKCHIFYGLYFILFLILLWVLFKDSTYVLGAFIFLCLAFFFQGYIALVLAPGVLPTIHFLDCPVILLTLLFLREKKGLYLLAAGVLSLGAIILNRQFGAMLAASFFVTVLFYVIEHREMAIRRMALRWGSVLLYVICMFLVFRYATIGATDGVLNTSFWGNSPGRLTPSPLS